MKRLKTYFGDLCLQVTFKNNLVLFDKVFYEFSYFGFTFDHLTIASFRILLELGMNCFVHFVIRKAIKHVHSKVRKLILTVDLKMLIISIGKKIKPP